ncbi:MAG TPA: response regulator transcription factor [bacterium]|nr:response regulator transcription factor [bacterium]
MKKILIVEDDLQIRKTLRDFLRHSNFIVCEAGRGDEALDVFQEEKPDLVVLDLNLPGKDGIEVCRDIRLDSNVPIIMLTARREEVDQVRGLTVGADDYIIKPFSPKVLVLKVQRMLGRPAPEDPERIRFRDLEIDLKKVEVKRVNRQGAVIDTLDLTPVEFKLLVALIRHPHKAFSRDQLIDAAYDDFVPPDIFDRTIDSHIKNLRKKLGVGDYIETVRGVGYRAKEL